MIIDGEGAEGATEDFAKFEQAAEAGETATPPEDDEGAEAGDPPDPDAEEGAEEDGEEGDPNVNDKDEDAGEEGDTPPKKKPPTAEDRIRDLNRKWRDEQKAREIDRKGFEARLAAIEAGKKGLTPDDDSGNEADERAAPDPKDLEKYPLGALDDRYIQDAIDYRAELAAEKIVGSLLERHEQSAEQAEAEQLLTDLRSKADTVASAGEKIHDDYKEVVLEAGLRGDYDLTQVTFEAAAEAENGAQILYDLASDPAEATRVAKLSPLQQLKFVAEKDAELSGKSASKIPGAKPPPGEQPKGRPARTTISPATENFEEFERLANKKT